MGYAIITKVFPFEAAHHLCYHKGKCARPHGHSYKLEVSVRGEIKNDPGESDHGMVMDFGDISQIVKETILSRLDHTDLNEVTGIYTTAEFLVHWIWDNLVAGGFPDPMLYRMRLWETETGYVEVTRVERETWT